MFAAPAGLAQSLSEMNTFQAALLSLLLLWLLYKHICTFALERRHVLPPPRHVSICTSRLLLSALVTVLGFNLALLTRGNAPRTEIEPHPCVATGQGEDKRSRRVQRVPVGDKVVQWVLQTGGNGTRQGTVTFNQPVLNCRLGPNLGQRSILGKP